MPLPYIKGLKKYFSKKEREKLFRKDLEETDPYEEQLRNKNLLDLKNERINLEIKLGNKRSLSEYIFQIISLGLSILILIVSIGYYILSDSTGLIGYSSYVNQRYESFKKANENISKINSTILMDNDLEKDKEYLELNNLLFEFTQNSNNRAMDICSSDDAYREYSKSFEEMIKKIGSNPKWEKYANQIYPSKQDIIKMGNINKEFAIFNVKITPIKQFYSFVTYSCVGLLIFFSLLIYLVKAYDDVSDKREYIFRKKLEIVNKLIDEETRKTHKNQSYKNMSDTNIKSNSREKGSLYFLKVICKLLNKRKM